MIALGRHGVTEGTEHLLTLVKGDGSMQQSATGEAGVRRRLSSPRLRLFVLEASRSE
jgi:archaeosine-15-forming tRNA-guanine transglycosylase